MLTIDKVQLEVIINSDPARVSLRKLEDEAKQLRKEMKKFPEDSDAWKKSFDKLKGVETQMEKLRHEIGLNGMTVKELQNRYRQLNAMMANMDPRLPQWKALKNEQAQVKQRLFELTGQAHKTSFSMGKLADSMNRYQTMALGVVGVVTGVVLSFRNLIRGNAELSDSLADVRKTTGMTEQEVKKLNAELRGINTRTSRKELLDLAKVAGKLGLEKESVLGFVKAADMINVALGEDLGGNAEDTMNSIGKIVDVFKVKQKFGIEEGMLKVGSAINSLGQASTANEGYLVDFAKRLGGIAPMAGISVDQVLGLGATLDQLGQQSETSSTAIMQLFTAMGKRTEDFARIAGMSLEDFSALLKNDANQALIKFLEGVKGNSDGLQQMSQVMNELKLEGARAIGVVGVLANNTGLLKDQQVLANREFTAGTSIYNEFNVKNNTLGANLEKLGKILHSMFIAGGVKEAINSIVESIVKWFEVPMSKKMDEERVQVNLLTHQLFEANISAETRNKLYNELHTLAPEILKGIDKESISYKTLGDNLRKYNEEMINRIVIQGKQEEIDKEIKKAAELQQRTLNTEMEIRKTIENEINSANKYNKEYYQGINEIMLGNESITKKAAMINALSLSVRGYEAAASSLRLNSNALTSYIKDYEDQLNRVLELTNEKEALMQRLNIGSSSGSINQVSGETNISGQEYSSLSGGSGISSKISSDPNKGIEYYQSELEKQAEAMGKAYRAGLEEFVIPADEMVVDEAQYLAEKYQETIEGRMAMTEAMFQAGEMSQAEYNDRMKLLYEEDARNHEEAIQEKIKVAEQYINGAMSLLDSLGTFNDAAMNREVSKAQESEKQQLSNKQLTDDQKKVITENTEKKIADIRKKFAKQNQAIAITEAIIQGALGIVKTGANLGYPLAIPFQIIQAIETAAQIALIASQQFASGNFADIIGASDGRKYHARVVGPDHRSGLFREPTFRPGFGLFGETRDPELVFNPRDTRIIMNTPGIINALNHTLGTRQYAQGNSREIIRESKMETFTDPALIEAITQLNKLLSSPIKTVLVANQDYIETHNEIAGRYDDLTSELGG